MVRERTPIKRLAIASTDGKVVNEHFGKADQFYIFDLAPQGPSFVELRRLNPVCDPNLFGGHAEDAMEARLEALKDCQAVFCARIGPGAASALIHKGIEPFEALGNIDEVLEEIQKEEREHESH